jgi:hypothetical protein
VAQMAQIVADLPEMQARIEEWLTQRYGANAPAFRPWFALDQESREGIVSADDMALLADGLVHCPHFAFYFDVHPCPAPDAMSYDVYVEPAGPRGTHSA